MHELRDADLINTEPARYQEVTDEILSKAASSLMRTIAVRCIIKQQLTTWTENSAAHQRCGWLYPAIKPYQYYELDNWFRSQYSCGSTEVLQPEIVYAGNSYETKRCIAATSISLIKNGTTTRTGASSMKLLNIMVLIATGPASMKRRLYRFQYQTCGWISLQ